MENTAVDSFYNEVRTHFLDDDGFLKILGHIYMRAKLKELDQHMRTWQAAIDQHESRGHVYSRSISDFDGYVIA